MDIVETISVGQVLKVRTFASRDTIILQNAQIFFGSSMKH